MATIEENLELIAENSQTIASDLSEIKTNLGLSSSSSLEDVVDKSERVVEPTGTINITENGTVDVSDYANANVNVPSSGGTYQTKTITPTTSSQTITPDAGYDALSQVNVNAVTASIDSNIQAENIKKNVSILGVVGTLESGGTQSKNVQFNHNIDGVKGVSGAVASNITLTVNKTGNYNIYWHGCRGQSTGTAYYSILYKNGSAYGQQWKNWDDLSTREQVVELNNVSLSEGDVLTLYGNTSSNTYYMYLSDLLIIEI